MALTWDVFATPIAACKLGRLGVEHGDVVVRPAFFRGVGDVYGAVARASCPYGTAHDVPGRDCSCGFYAVGTEDELWRLGGENPELAVLEVELSGRVIEHDHGYRASNQRIRRVRLHGRCTRCGRRAEVLHHQRFGALVPACRRCARRPVTIADASASLGAPVTFDADEASPASGLRRVGLMLVQALGPVAVVALGIALALVWYPAVALALAQAVLLAWLALRPRIVKRVGSRLGVCAGEVARLEHRWNGAVMAYTFGCVVAVGVASVTMASVVTS